MSGYSIEIEEAKNWYIQKKRQHPIQTFTGTEPSLLNVSPFAVEPSWDFAEKGEISQTKETIYVPLSDRELLQDKWNMAMLMLNKDRTGEIKSKTVLFVADKTYYETVGTLPNLENFTGLLFQVNEEGEMGLLTHALNGEIQNFGNAAKFGLVTEDDDKSDDDYAFYDIGAFSVTNGFAGRDGCLVCWGDASNVYGLWNKIMCSIKNLFNPDCPGGDTDISDAGAPTPFLNDASSGGSPYITGTMDEEGPIMLTGGGGGCAGCTSVGDHLSVPDFAAQLLLGMVSSYDYPFTKEELVEIIPESCMQDFLAGHTLTNLPTTPPACAVELLDAYVEVANWLDTKPQFNSDEKEWMKENFMHTKEVIMPFMLEYNLDEKVKIFIEVSSTTSISNEELIDLLLDVPDGIILTSSFLKNEKARCVYYELKKTENNLFLKTIGAFIDSEELELRLSADESIFEGGDNYATDGVAIDDDLYTKGELTIAINPNYIDSSIPLVEIAGTLLHEGIHAAMYHWLYTKGKVDDLRINEKKSVWNRYLNEYYNGSVENTQEAFMANYYVDELARGLKDFDKKPQFSMDSYKYIAWDGLRDYSQILDQQANENFKNLHFEMIIQAKKSCQ